MTIVILVRCIPIVMMVILPLLLRRLLLVILLLLVMSLYGDDTDYGHAVQVVYATNVDAGDDVAGWDDDGDGIVGVVDFRECGVDDAMVMTIMMLTMVMMMTMIVMTMLLMWTLVTATTIM